MLKIVKGMEDDISVGAMLWKLQKLKHAIALYEEQLLRNNRDND